MSAPAAPLDPATAADLLRRAVGARAHAYAPYSRFPVGAALLAEDGRVFTGANVENASYGLTTCAERTALVKAVSEGARAFRAIAVAGPEEDEACPPCGSCRQLLHELAPGVQVVLAGAGGAEVIPLSTLLPRAFDAPHLRDGRSGG